MANLMKKKSKRQSAKKRYKIEKKVRQHNKKEKKKDRKSTTSKRRKDPGVPSSLPFKETILKEAEDIRNKLQEERDKKKERQKKNRTKMLAQRRGLQGLVSAAEKRASDYEKRKAAQTSAAPTRAVGGKAVETSLKTFYKEFRKVVDAADVVLEVLDARDPLGSRCAQMEEMIISSGANKRLVLVLNKIDLVPRENVEAWLKHLRNEFPTIAFKASTQTQSHNLCRSKMSIHAASDDLLKTSHCLGADLLMKLLANYCRSQDIKTSIRVGVVGFPNTGKSSIINSLKRSKCCNVGATPGITKTMQEVQLDKHIKLLDSPGVVMATGASDTATILRNCVKLETLADPSEAVNAILRRCNKEQIMLHYGIPNYESPSEFMSLLAVRLGRLKKGGVPDVNKAANALLQDWTSGKITYYTHPPEQHTMPTHISAAFVTQMGQEFNVAELDKEEKVVLEGLERQSIKHMLVESSGPSQIVMDETELEAGNQDTPSNEDTPGDDEEMSEDDEDTELKDVTVKVPSTGSQTPAAKTSKKPSKQATRALVNVQLNKDRKQDLKKMKKQRKKADKVAGALSDALTEAFKFGGKEKADEDYDFGKNFS